MRSPSQTFHDSLVARDYKKAMDLLSQYGVNTLNAVSYTALHSWRGAEDENAILDRVFAAETTPEIWIDALLLRIGHRSITHDPVTQRLLDRCDARLLNQRHPLHHAAYHGCHYILPALMQKMENAGVWTGWDPDVRGLGTPLFIALRELNQETATFFLRQGCDESKVLQHGTKGADGERSVEQAARIHCNDKEGFDNFIKTAKNKVKLEKIAESAARLLEKSEALIRKIKL